MQSEEEMTVTLAELTSMQEAFGVEVIMIGRDATPPE